MKEALNIIFLGTPDFAVDSLAALLQQGFHISAVVTAPDQPAGRGQVMQSSPVKKYALQHGLKVLQPIKLKDPGFLRELSSFHADLFIVVAFRMLPEIVWQMPRLGTFNLHASLLPQYRGAAPINHVIINGETVTGLTTFFLKQEIDTGAIIYQEKMPIYPEDTAGELHDRMKTAGANLVLKTAEAISTGNLKTIEQRNLIEPSIPLKTAPKIFREDCRIEWTMNIDEVYNKIRGLSPYPAAFTYFTSPSGESFLVKIYKTIKSVTRNHMQPAVLITDGKSDLAVTTANGILHIREIQQAGKRIMKIEEFMRGFRVNSDWKVG
ncbi:MAG: methionyl-tRNA formyltransferase [Bacteroidales bacterium]|nr:methionyl-tRNA formyltransferase [Bacteroidales bacterium]